MQGFRRARRNCFHQLSQFESKSNQALERNRWNPNPSGRFKTRPSGAHEALCPRENWGETRRSHQQRWRHRLGFLIPRHYGKNVGPGCGCKHERHVPLHQGICAFNGQTKTRCNSKPFFNRVFPRQVSRSALQRLESRGCRTDQKFCEPARALRARE